MTMVVERYAIAENAAWIEVGSVPRNVLDGFPSSVLKFTNKADNLKYQLEFAAKLTKDSVGPILGLLRENMKESYEQSGWGWNEKKKQHELMHEDARYLLVKDEVDGR